MIVEKPRPRHRTDSPSTLGREVWELLFRLFRAERPTLLAVCHDYELTPPQAYLLNHLEPEKPMAMNGFAEALACDASNITGIVDKLEARGLIRRQPDPADRRVKMIALTESGAKFRANLLKRLLEPPASLAALPEAEKRILRDILQRTVNAAEKRRRSA